MRRVMLAAALLLVFTRAFAQPAPVCAPPVLLSLARAGSACFNLGNNEACYGGGVVEASTFDGAAALSLPGDRAAVNAIEHIAVAPADEGVSVVLLNIQASLPDADQRRVAVLLIGEAALDNLVPPTPEQILTALGNVNIRALPAIQTDIAARIPIGQTMTANGITEDGAWLRVEIPNTDELGWVGTDVVSSDGDVRALAVVRPDTPRLTPFEVLTVTSSHTFSACDGALIAGVLIQSPNVETPVALTLNETTFQLAGTAFIQNGGDLTIVLLEGEAVTDSIFVPAGAQYVAGAVDPLTVEPLAGLPVNNLPRRFAVAAPLTREQIADLTAAFAARVEATPIAVATLAPDTSCRRIALRAVSLWAGPGDFYEAVNELAAGSPVSPVLQILDPEGEAWWQLRGSNWVRARLIQETGECDPVPLTDRFAPPSNNTLSLETCLTTNGPLREGQRVRIEFRPAPFDNLGEARDAVIIDPGRIIIDADRYRTYATDPIKLGTPDDRYIRTFYIDWIAVPGTYRIEGDRLTYTPICSITVPVG